MHFCQIPRRCRCRWCRDHTSHTWDYYYYLTVFTALSALVIIKLYPPTRDHTLHTWDYYYYLTVFTALSTLVIIKLYPPTRDHTLHTWDYYYYLTIVTALSTLVIKLYPPKRNLTEGYFLKTRGIRHLPPEDRSRPQYFKRVVLCILTTQFFSKLPF